jgi:hypothetical protein
MSPAGSNLGNLCMHLTNYAINKDNTNFKADTSAEGNTGHKRSLDSIFIHLAK